VRDLTVGDVIPDGAPGTAWFVVTTVDRPRMLVLHSTTHVPVAWRERLGAAIDWTWTMHLSALPGGGTRLHLRVRGRTAPWWLTAAYHTALVPADFIMAMGMLRGIKDRAECAAPPRRSGREPYTRVDPPRSHLRAGTAGDAAAAAAVPPRTWSDPARRRR
jgi:hypothetical protein